MESDKLKGYVMQGNGDKPEKDPQPQPSNPERQDEYTKDAPLKEDKDLPDLIEPEKDWDNKLKGSE